MCTTHRVTIPTFYNYRYIWWENCFGQQVFGIYRNFLYTALEQHQINFIEGDLPFLHEEIILRWMTTHYPVHAQWRNANAQGELIPPPKILETKQFRGKRITPLEILLQNLPEYIHVYWYKLVFWGMNIEVARCHQRFFQTQFSAERARM